MSPRAVVLLLALAGCGAPLEAPPAGSPAPAAPAVLTARPEVREIDGAVPDDLQIDARADDRLLSTVHVQRPGHLITLRRGNARAAGPGEVSLAVPHRDDAGAPFVWETTHLDTLETTRGVLRFDVDGRPHLRMAPAPVPVGREEHHRHTCRSQDDGEGGFTVLCRVDHAFGRVLNLTSPDQHALAWSFLNGSDAIVRLDLPARPGSAEGRLLTYTYGSTGVVVRAEASFLAGEERASLALLSSDRAQPPPVPHHRHFF